MRIVHRCSNALRKPSHKHDPFLLMEWLRSGAPYPKEVIIYFSKVLVLFTAVVRCFTICKTIEEYAEACSYYLVATFG